MSLALFLSLLVKSSLIAAAGLIVARFVARRAAERVDILRATICLLLALPLLVPSVVSWWLDRPSRLRRVRQRHGVADDVEQPGQRRRIARQRLLDRALQDLDHVRIDGHVERPAQLGAVDGHGTRRAACRVARAALVESRHRVTASPKNEL